MNNLIKLSLAAASLAILSGPIFADGDNCSALKQLPSQFQASGYKHGLCEGTAQIDVQQEGANTVLKVSPHYNQTIGCTGQPK